ncbi:hypothetical protein B0A67_24005 [Flavobacterium aquidurense]|jgi:hypothetical protein|uniref:hypothetical protein n=1 Tax=Flavobacterium aquidurense TaxID=362413 RepID=UPI000911B1E7|nr:hypothetical protein [Flavobacterium aquidurense]OXA65949.1 hypothetical protein B0A67_24005 [Flavobacterium aquidurense]SHH85197.1 hypothetical protein SAMN05444481_13423 [Flavobacterium frigidimaris]
MEEKSKGYVIHKKINQPARIIGLYYNTFFVFVLVSAIIIMGLSSKFALFGILYGGIFSIVIYFFLFYYQTKYGPKKIAKIVNNFYNPIDFIKMKKSIKKMY